MKCKEGQFLCHHPKSEKSDAIKDGSTLNLWSRLLSVRSCVNDDQSKKESLSEEDYKIHMFENHCPITGLSIIKITEKDTTSDSLYIYEDITD